MKTLPIVPVTTVNAKEAKAEYLTAFEPFEPGSVKHQELIEYFRAAEAAEPAYVGMAGHAEKKTDPNALGRMYGQTLGVQPEFPDTDGPAWATGHDDPGVDMESNPTRLWHRELAEALWHRALGKPERVSASINRDDTFDIDAEKVVEGAIELSVWIGGNDGIVFTSPDLACQAGQYLIDAAEQFEKILSKGALPESV